MRRTAWVVVLILMSSLAVLTAATQAPAVEPPPGGIVDSAPNFGWTQGDFSVSDDGAAQYSLPLWVPAGRGRATPALSLSYSSQSGNGPLGMGWALGGLPSIAPCPRTIAQDGFSDTLHFDGSDAYCLGESRLMPVSPPHPSAREYRTEREIFARIIGYGMQDGVPDFFRIWARDGRILTLGSTAGSRLAAFRLVANASGQFPEVIPESPTTRVTVSWAVDRIEDRNGNAATVEYERTDGDSTGVWWTSLRPSVIRYEPNRRVQFVYEGRPDLVDGFGGGVHTRQAYRLRRIEMYGGPQGGTAEKLREYRFDYANTSITGRSLLTFITECDSAGACKQPLPMEYTPGGYDFHVSTTAITDVGTSEASRNRIIVGDITGDGRDDLLYQDPQNFWKVRHSTGTSFGAAIPAGIARVDATTRGDVRIIDFDVDGRMDIMVEAGDLSEGGTGWRLYRSNGATFEPFVDQIGSSSGPYDDDLDPIYFLDLDGNGRPDFLRAPWDVRSGDDPPYERNDGPWSYRLNTGATGTNMFAPPLVTDVMGPNQHGGNTVVDTDGDGRAELLGLSDIAPEGSTNRTIGLNPAGVVEALPVRFPRTQSMGDFNGDGLVDTVNALFAGVRVTLSVGNAAAFALGPNNGYVPPRDFELPVGGGFFDRGVRIVDFNNDGRSDVLVFRGGDSEGPTDAANGLQVYTWGNPVTKTDPGLVRVPLSVFTGAWDFYAGFAWSQVLDIDGNGVLDIAHVQNGLLRILRRTNEPPDRLVAIGNTLYSGRVELDYTTLADRTVHTPGSCTSPALICPTAGGTVVAQHRTATFVGSGGSAWDRYDHTYEGARLDLRGRGWLGFARSTVTRLATDATTVNEFDNVSLDSATKAYAFAHLPRKTTYTVKDSPTGREFRSTNTVGHVIHRYPGGGFAVEPRTVVATEQERAVGSTAWQTLRTNSTESTYDEFGNADLTVSSTVGGRSVTADPSFRNDTGAWLIGLPTRQLTTGCTVADVCTTRETTFDHDDKGNHTVTVVEPDRAALRLSTVTEYGEFGIVLSVTRTDNTGDSRRDTFEYSNDDKLHPTARINALGHRTVIDTHSGLGVPIRSIDPDGVTMITMRYDRFGRLRETNRSDGSWEHISHGSLFGAQQLITNVAGGGHTSTLLDQLGRERERRVRGVEGRTATVYLEYDSLGRLHRVSQPTWPGATPLYTTSTHDRRSRLTSVTEPDGAVVHHEYINRETHTYDARNVHSYVVTTVDGDVGSRYEDDPTTTNWLRTRFEYGPFGETTRMVAADGTAQTMHYDILGRRDQLIDPSSGTTSTKYNAFGEVDAETNGAGETTKYRHDALGRIRRIESPDGVATNTWDTANNGIGKVAIATSADGVSVRHTYNALGQPATTTWNIDATPYQFRFGYDDVGRPSSTEYPAIPGASGRLKVTNVYNQHGYLSQVKDAAADGTVYWTAEERNGAGQLTRERYGNGVVTTRAFEPTTDLLEQITATGPGTVGNLVSIDYRYDANRNVIGRHDRVNKRFETYNYDELNRLERWHTEVPGLGYIAIDATYGYDKVGNLTTETFQRQGEQRQEVTYAYGENGASAHALTSRNAATYTYDGAGRQITGPQRTIEYNRAGLPTVLTRGQGQRTEYAYDPNGARVRKWSGLQSVVYAGGLFERRTPAGVDETDIHNLHNIVVEGRTVAQVNWVQADSGGPVTRTVVRYLHADQQDSTVAVSNASGEPVGGEDSFLGAMFYDPFGRRVGADYEPLGHQVHGGPRQGYTGHEHDDEHGLINMLGRMYDPLVRRFLTPDPFVAEPLQSQHHNRYAYVQNNPVTLTDPTGLISSDGRGVYSFYGGGMSRVGGFWLNYSLLEHLTQTPFNAQLVTHVVQVFSPVVLAGSSDDDAAVKRNIATIAAVGKVRSIAGILDPYAVLEAEREAAKARSDARHGGAFWSWASGEREAIDEYYDQQERELARRVPRDMVERLKYFQELLKDDIRDQQLLVMELRAIAQVLKVELARLKESDGRTAEEIEIEGQDPHPPWAAIHAIESTLEHYMEQIEVESRLLKSLERDLPGRLQTLDMEISDRQFWRDVGSWLQGQ